MKKTSENYDLSISDLFSGALFIFIILLVYFMIQFDNKKDKLTKPLNDRAELLESMKKELGKRNIKVTIDKVDGIMSIPIDKNCSYFESGEYTLSHCGKNNFNKIKRVFMKTLPCYIDGKSNCKKAQRKSPVGTVLIEGHTDYTPIGKSYRNNCTEKGRIKQRSKCSQKCKKKCGRRRNRKSRRCFEKCTRVCYKKIDICAGSNLHLSTMRSRNVYSFLLDYKERERKTPEGNSLYNLKTGKVRIFGVAGFGPTRPKGKGGKYDRRIDFRFVMENPKEIMQEIKKELENKK